MKIPEAMSVLKPTLRIALQSSSLSGAYADMSYSLRFSLKSSLRSDFSYPQNVR